MSSNKNPQMKAIVQNDYGSPDVFELKEIDKPVVEDNDVLVRVHAAALASGDYFGMRGEPYVARFSVGWRNAQHKTSNHSRCDEMSRSSIESPSTPRFISASSASQARASPYKRVGIARRGPHVQRDHPGRLSRPGGPIRRGWNAFLGK